MSTTTSERLQTLGLELHTAEQVAQLSTAELLADLLAALEALRPTELAKLAAAAEALWSQDGLNARAADCVRAITYASIESGRYGFRHVGGYCMPSSVTDRAHHAAEDIWWVAIVSDLAGKHGLTVKIARTFIGYYSPLPESLERIFSKLLSE
jgi:hypothetical protein